MFAGWRYTQNFIWFMIHYTIQKFVVGNYFIYLFIYILKTFWEDDLLIKTHIFVIEIFHNILHALAVTFESLLNKYIIYSSQHLKWIIKVHQSCPKPRTYFGGFDPLHTYSIYIYIYINFWILVYHTHLISKVQPLNGPIWKIKQWSYMNGI